MIRRRSRVPLILVPVILGAIASLAPLAHASPPDPSWIAGLWDNGDYDDVVLLATSGVGTADSHPSHATMSAVVVVASLPPADENRRSARPPSRWHTRAPPFHSV